MERPDNFKDELLSFMDTLPSDARENMFLTVESLLRHYPHLSAKELQDLLLSWVQSAEASFEG